MIDALEIAAWAICWASVISVSSFVRCADSASSFAWSAFRNFTSPESEPA